MCNSSAREVLVILFCPLHIDWFIIKCCLTQAGIKLLLSEGTDFRTFFCLCEFSHKMTPDGLNSKLCLTQQKKKKSPHMSNNQTGSLYRLALMVVCLKPLFLLLSMKAGWDICYSLDESYKKKTRFKNHALCIPQRANYDRCLQNSFVHMKREICL